jgi:hypothetical protein
MTPVGRTGRSGCLLGLLKSKRCARPQANTMHMHEQVSKRCDEISKVTPLACNVQYLYVKCFVAR